MKFFAHAPKKMKQRSTLKTKSLRLFGRTCARMAILVVTWASIGSVMAQTTAAYPSKPVHVVVGFPAGGPVDTLARAIGEKLSQSMGQQFIVENVAGATGIIANQRVAKAAPDGYTLLMGASTIPIQATLNKSLPYDTLRDLTPIAYVGDSPLLLVVPPSSPVRNVHELVAYIKANPGKLAYGSAGTGSGNHLAGELFKKMAGLDITHVPYKGAAPAEVDVMGGHVSYIFDAFTSGLKLVESGRLRALAVTTDTRATVSLDIPTMAESGFPGFSVSTWYGLIGPGNLPPDVVRRLNEEVNKALAQPDLQARLVAMGLQARPQATAQFSSFIKKEVEKWAAVIKESGVQQVD